jgi:hypothetical protein
MLSSVRNGGSHHQKLNSTTAQGFRNTQNMQVSSPMSLVNTSQAGAKQSSMLEQEMKAIEKIKSK